MHPTCKLQQPSHLLFLGSLARFAPSEEHQREQNTQVHRDLSFFLLTTAIGLATGFETAAFPFKVLL